MPVEGVGLGREIGDDVGGTVMSVAAIAVGDGKPAIVSSTMVATAFGSKVGSGMLFGRLQAARMKIRMMYKIKRCDFIVI